MKFLAYLATTGLVAGLSHSASARQPLALEPSSPWILDYDADSCTLRRTFGEGPQQAQLEMRRFQPGLDLQVTVATKARTTKRPFRYRFDPADKWEDEEMPLHVFFDGGQEGVIFKSRLVEVPFARDGTPEDWADYYQTVDYRSLESDAAAKVESLTVSRAFRDDVILRTGSLKAPMNALNECIDELLNHWQINVEAHKSLTRLAFPVNVLEVSRRLKYPPMMLREGLPGLVNLRFAVDEVGQITACHIQMPLSDPEFERVSCRDIQRHLKFSPALDKDGNPIPSYWVTSVRFHIG